MVTITVASIDWVLSLDPDFTSTDFAAMMAVSQLAAALALAAVLGLRPGKATGDWGGLLLATVLGVFYLSAMQFLVSWSGDLPSKAAWFAARGGLAGTAIIDTAFVVGACLPVAILLSSALRRAPGALRGAGAAVLFGNLAASPLADHADADSRGSAGHGGDGPACHSPVRGASGRPGDGGEGKPMSDRLPEDPGVALGWVLPLIAAAFVILGLGVGAVWLFYPSVRTPIPLQVSPLPAPELETRPVADDRRWRAQERARLEGKDGWLPISSAMARIAARGPAAFDPVEVAK